MTYALSPKLQAECIRVLDRYYGLVVNVEQLESVLATDPEFRAALIKYNSPSDTADREVLIDLFVRDIVGRRWPVYGDGEGYTREFFEDYKRMAAEKGYTVRD